VQSVGIGIGPRTGERGGGGAYTDVAEESKSGIRGELVKLVLAILYNERLRKTESAHVLVCDTVQSACSTLDLPYPLP
jgi:hypothetical protein